MVWGVVAGFSFFAAYYTLRPVREEISSEHLGLRSELFGITFFATLAAALAIGLLARRLSRRGLLLGVFTAVVVPLFFFRFGAPAFLATDAESVLLDKAFYVWVNVLVMVGSTMLWVLLSDVFPSSEAKRTFGLFFFGTTSGQLLASGFVSFGAVSLGREGLLTTSLVLLVMTVFAVDRVLRASRSRYGKAPAVGLSISAAHGLTAILRSRQLRTICLYLATYTCGSTLLYFVKTDLVAEAFDDRMERIAFFGRLDFWVGASCLLPQLFLTGRAILSMGLRSTLLVLPLASALGFALLALLPGFTLLVIVESLRRSLNFVFAKPSREVLFTGVSEADRYAAKPLIDTAWYRGTDWLESEVLDALSLTPTGSALLGVPVALSGAWLGWRMGRTHEANLAEDSASPEPGVPGPV